MDRLCKLLKVETLDEWDERHIDAFWDDLRYLDFDSEEEREAAQLKAEQEARDESWTKYRDAVLSVAEDLFGEHGLTLVPARPSSGRSRKGWTPERSWEFRIKPTVSWPDAASHLRETIDGYGMFVFGTLRSFLDSGPYTAREAVVNHLGWMRHWYEIYGDGSAWTRLERRLR
jgi:hypothetical protein